MIDPKHQWCLQIDVTNACPRQCSNCTHLVGHLPLWFMDPDVFRECVLAAKDFPQNSTPAEHTKYKLIGIIGGEPLLHPRFDELAIILETHVPYEHRGLWTGLPWEYTKHAKVIKRVFPDYGIHCNLHEGTDVHTPVLVAASETVDAETCRQLIDDCWLQRRWASTFTPHGFYCCEVMGGLAALFGQVAGLPIKPGCWKRPLEDFQYLIDTICRRCGVALNYKGRPASDGIDDISPGNLRDCQQSLKILTGKYEVFDPLHASAAEVPWRYKRKESE